MNIRKSIFIYYIEEKIFLRANSRTNLGMSMEFGPYFIVEHSLNSIELGYQILRTFEECKVGIPHPEDLTKLSVLEKADPYSISTEAKLLKKLKKNHKDLRLGIEYDGVEYHFVPYKVHSKQGSTPMYEKQIHSDGSPENLGSTLLQALKLCE